MIFPIQKESIMNYIYCLNSSPLHRTKSCVYLVKTEQNIIELFFDKTEAFHIVDGRITDEHVMRVVNHWYRLQVDPRIKFTMH